QAVSRWERGTSRPRRADIGRLAHLLGLDAHDLLAAAGYVAPTADSPDQVRLPVRPLSLTLPLDELAPDVFEQFSVDLAKALHPNAAVHRWGDQGHNQGGIDVIVMRDDGTQTVIQCKRQKRFGPAKVREAVRALDLDAGECFIYLSR